MVLCCQLPSHGVANETTGEGFNTNRDYSSFRFRSFDQINQLQL
jgi:hypothetical protein